MELSDNKLIRAALAGSLPAWDTLVRRYESRVYNFSLRMTGNPDDALDLMQDVFLAVFRKLALFRGDAQFSTWLFRIAHNKSVDMLRRGPPAGQVSLEGAESEHGHEWQLDNSVDPAHAFAADRQRLEIIMALRALPPDQRLTLELKFFQELTFEDIADITDTSVNTVKTRFYAAIKKLQNSLERDIYDLP